MDIGYDYIQIVEDDDWALVGIVPPHGGGGGGERAKTAFPSKSIPLTPTPHPNATPSPKPHFINDIPAVMDAKIVNPRRRIIEKTPTPVEPPIRTSNPTKPRSNTLSGLGSDSVKPNSATKIMEKIPKSEDTKSEIPESGGFHLSTSKNRGKRYRGYNK